METKKRRQYTEEFKKDALEMVRRSPQPLTSVADDRGICPDVLYRWKRESNSLKTDPEIRHDAEFERLKRELADVRMERDILKKALAIFSQKNPR